MRGFKPFSEMPEAMAAADVLVAVLEPDAGVFSVPSKVLAYLCGGRPVLLAVPPENLAARIVARETAGLVVPPDDAAGFLAHAETLMARSDLRDDDGPQRPRLRGDRLPHRRHRRPDGGGTQNRRLKDRG